LTSDSNNQINILDISEQNYSIKSQKNCDINNLDYQLYGEAPPSYQQSKYFPVIRLEEFKEDDDAHNYEDTYHMIQMRKSELMRERKGWLSITRNKIRSF
jgi:hypothetical protein